MTTNQSDTMQKSSAFDVDFGRRSAGQGLASVNICSRCLDKQTRTVEFRWIGNEQLVYLAASFLQNGAMVRMTQVYDGFLTCFELPPGHFDFKFFVDGQWRLSDQYFQHFNVKGNEMNYVHVV